MSLDCRVSSAKAGSALISHCLHRITGCNLCSHTFPYLTVSWCFYFFNAGTISAFKSVLQMSFNIQVLATIPPHCDKYSAAAFHKPLLHLSQISSHLSFKGSSLYSSLPLGNGEASCGFCKGHFTKAGWIQGRTWGLKTISGLRSLLFSPAWKLYSYPDFHFLPRAWNKKKCLHPISFLYILLKPH